MGLALDSELSERGQLPKWGLGLPERGLGVAVSLYHFKGRLVSIGRHRIIVQGGWATVCPARKKGEESFHILAFVMGAD